MALPSAMSAPQRSKTPVEVGLALDIPGRAGMGWTVTGTDRDGNVLLTRPEGDLQTAIKISADNYQAVRGLPHNANRRPPIKKFFNAGQTLFFKEGQAEIHGFDGAANRYLVSGTINGKYYQTWVDGDKVNAFAFDPQHAAPELVKAVGMEEKKPKEKTKEEKVKEKKAAGKKVEEEKPEVKKPEEKPEEKEEIVEETDIIEEISDPDKVEEAVEEVNEVTEEQIIEEEKSKETAAPETAGTTLKQLREQEQEQRAIEARLPALPPEQAQSVEQIISRVAFDQDGGRQARSRQTVVEFFQKDPEQARKYYGASRTELVKQYQTSSDDEFLAGLQDIGELTAQEAQTVKQTGRVPQLRAELVATLQDTNKFAKQEGLRVAGQVRIQAPAGASSEKIQIFKTMALAVHGEDGNLLPNSRRAAVAMYQQDPRGAAKHFQDHRQMVRQYQTMSDQELINDLAETTPGASREDFQAVMMAGELPRLRTELVKAHRQVNDFAAEEEKRAQQDTERRQALTPPPLARGGAGMAVAVQMAEAAQPRIVAIGLPPTMPRGIGLRAPARPQAKPPPGTPKRMPGPVTPMPMAVQMATGQEQAVARQRQAETLPDTFTEQLSREGGTGPAPIQAPSAYRGEAGGEIEQAKSLRLKEAEMRAATAGLIGPEAEEITTEGITEIPPEEFEEIPPEEEIEDLTAEAQEMPAEDMELARQYAAVQAASQAQAATMAEQSKRQGMIGAANQALAKQNQAAEMANQAKRMTRIGRVLAEGATVVGLLAAWGELNLAWINEKMFQNTFVRKFFPDLNLPEKVVTGCANCCACLILLLVLALITIILVAFGALAHPLDAIWAAMSKLVSG